MQNSVKPDAVNYLGLIGDSLRVGFILGLLSIFLLAILGVKSGYLEITTIIGLIIAFLMFYSGYKQQKISKYINAISSAYRRSIKAALETEYPQGIIYIIGNTLKELEKFGINNQPNKYSYSNSESWSNNNGYGYSKSTSDVRGFPNRTNLKAAIYQAENLSREWGGLNNVERINAMKEIWAMIEKEDMWLDWTVMKVYLGKKIYWYSYDESDSRNITITERHSNTINAGQGVQQLSSSTQPIFNPTTSTQSGNKVLSINEFLQQNPELFYHSEREQREEHHKYLASMGVQPPLSGNFPNRADNSSYMQEEKEDDSIW